MEISGIVIEGTESVLPPGRAIFISKFTQIPWAYIPSISSSVSRFGPPAHPITGNNPTISTMSKNNFTGR
jgi:hypothetical protein